MLLGKVVGKIVSTVKADKLQGKKILLVVPIDADRNVTGKELVSIDGVGAGIGDEVLVTSGSSAKYIFEDLETPIDSSIVAIVDVVEKR